MMTRPTLIVLAFAAVVGCNNPAADVPAATVGSGEGATPPSTPTDDQAAPAEAPADEAQQAEASGEAAAEQIGPSGTAALNPQNTQLQFVGSKVTASHEGGFSAFTGTVETHEGGVAGGKVTLTIDMTTIFADRPRLTDHLRSDDFFDVANHPQATFESTNIAPAEADGTYTVTGNLTIKGTTQTITFDAEIAVVDGRVKATAEFSIDRQLWGINYTGMPDDLIRDEVVLRWNIDAPIA